MSNNYCLPELTSAYKSQLFIGLAPLNSLELNLPNYIINNLRNRGVETVGELLLHLKDLHHGWGLGAQACIVIGNALDRVAKLHARDIRDMTIQEREDYIAVESRENSMFIAYHCGFDRVK